MQGAERVRIAAIVAMDEGRVIGNANAIPWHIPEDLKHFAKLTTGHSVLMGRKTYDSIPEKFRPLPNRHNIIVTRSKDLPNLPAGVQVYSDLEEYLQQVRRGEILLPSSFLWVLGGAEIYRASYPYWDSIFLTRVRGKHPGDTFFSAFEQDFELEEKEDHGTYAFERYRRIP